METYIGRITKDATTSKVGEKNVVNFTIAKNRRYKVGKEIKEKTTYIECGYWNVPAIAPYLKSGTLVEVAGDTGCRAYTDREGKVHAVLTLFVHELNFHGSPKKSGSEAPREEPEIPAGDLPF